MLHSIAGDRVDAARLARNSAVHQLTARLSVERGQTRLHIERQDPPWKIVRAFPQADGSVVVHLNNVSGGVLAGDRLAFDLTLERGAVAQVTTTGATRLYRHRAGREDSEQHTTITLGEGALLEYLPDAVIPFSGSRHAQRTTITLAAGATLFWWETLAPGRLAAGERFRFDRLQVQSSVRVGGRLAFKEDFTLRPGERDPATTARMGEYSHVASLYTFQEGRSAADWRKMEDRLNQIAPAGMWGASTLSTNGVIVRGLSRTGREIPAALIEYWNMARQFLTGEPARPPRKVY